MKIRAASNIVKALAVLFATHALAAPTGSIQGRVLAANGTPLAGAIVSAHTALPSASGPRFLPTVVPIPVGPLLASATSDADGSFTLKGLPSGGIVICVDPGVGKNLNPCLWSASPPRAQLADGQRIQGHEIQLQPGAVVSIRVLDAGRLIAAGGAGRERDLRAGVIGHARMFLNAALVSSDSTGRTYAISVPLDTSLRSIVQSHDLKINDAVGNAIPATGLLTPLSVATGTVNAPVLTISVVGVK